MKQITNQGVDVNPIDKGFGFENRVNARVHFDGWEVLEFEGHLRSHLFAFGAIQFNQCRPNRIAGILGFTHKKLRNRCLSASAETSNLLLGVTPFLEV